MVLFEHFGGFPDNLLQPRIHTLECSENGTKDQTLVLNAGIIELKEIFFEGAFQPAGVLSLRVGEGRDQLGKAAIWVAKKVQRVT